MTLQLFKCKLLLMGQSHQNLVPGRVGVLSIFAILQQQKNRKGNKPHVRFWATSMEFEIKVHPISSRCVWENSHTSSGKYIILPVQSQLTHFQSSCWTFSVPSALQLDTRMYLGGLWVPRGLVRGARVVVVVMGLVRGGSRVVALGRAASHHFRWSRGG